MINMLCQTCGLHWLVEKPESCPVCTAKPATRAEGCTGMKTTAIRLLADVRHFNPRAWKALCDAVKEDSITEALELADDKILVNVSDGLANTRIMLDLNSCTVSDKA